EVGLAVDEAGYDVAMGEQRERSRAAAQFKRGGDADLWADKGLPGTEFVGYGVTVAQATILALVANGDDVSSAAVGAQVQLVLDRTPFYAESGGQVGDSGLLVGPAGAVRVEDTQRPAPGLTVHYGVVESGLVAVGEALRAEVDVTRRADIERNHTATHMLQRALRDVVGEHAAQAGSLVAPERLRFDFTHNRAVEPAQLREIEVRLNAWVRADGAVSWAVMDYQSAIDAGAIALFGEKYGDRVRLVTVDRGPGTGDRGPGFDPAAGPRTPVPEFSTRDSRELCGGTHVGRTGEIGYVRLVGESSVGSGIRRIEALTGRGAELWVEQQAEALRDLAGRLGVPVAQVAERVDLLIGEGKQRQQELDALRGKLARASIEGLLDTVRRDGPAPVLAAQVQAEDANRLREMGDWLRDKLGSGVIVLGTVIGEKPQILTMVTPDLVGQGYHAGNLVKSLAQIVGGGGGGRPEMAQAGGRDVSKLGEAIARAPDLVAEQKK
ncbi:alanine--tRNA ligase, partial [bacterium]|nr:alanine--tRNA ligase [bacterium]